MSPNFQACPIGTSSIAPVIRSASSFSLTHLAFTTFRTRPAAVSDQNQLRKVRQMGTHGLRHSIKSGHGKNPFGFSVLVADTFETLMACQFCADQLSRYCFRGLHKHYRLSVTILLHPDIECYIMIYTFSWFDNIFYAIKNWY